MLKPLLTAVPPNIVVIKSRADFFARFRIQALEWDSSQPVKNWIDQSAIADPDTPIDYTGIKYDANGNPVFDANRVVAQAHFSLFVEVAQSVNLLPEPMKAQGELTPTQLKMSQRQWPLPLALKPGERVVLAPGIGIIEVIDDGVASPGAPAAGGFTESDRAMLHAIAVKVGA